MSQFVVFIPIAFLFVLINGVAVENFIVKIRKVDRVIDLATHLVKISEVFTVENGGNNSVKLLQYAVCAHNRNLAYIGFQTEDSLKTPLQYTEQVLEDKTVWTVELKEHLQPGKITIVGIDTVFSHQMVPYPKKITQNEKQMVLYHGNHYVFSGYPIDRQTTTVKLGSNIIESYSILKPMSLSKNTLNYGPYYNIAPYSFEKLTIYLENNTPFLTVTNLVRIIEVSHWGNIAVEETVDLLHTGAVLKLPFSRDKYQRETSSASPSVNSFKTLLPAAAKDVYYRDEIGNISTSRMTILSDSVELYLRPRFPLFGGWKTQYILGYNLPSYEYLYNSGDDYLLNMRLIDHIFDDMIVEEGTTKIILPEGCHSVQLSALYPIQQSRESLNFTHLDTKGRLVITFHRTNLVENHIQDFKLYYKFPRMLILREPLLIIISFYLLFLLVIVYVRLDFSIAKDEVEENRVKVASYCERILTHHFKRVVLYKSLDEQLAKLKSSKDVNAFQLTMKNFNQEYESETAHIADLLINLQTDSPEIAEKVVNLVKFDKELRDFYRQLQILYVDVLVTGKIVEARFLKIENNLNKKKENCSKKINSVVKSLQYWC